MASILDRYGIKEVADLTFYDLETSKPVLYIDTAKVSTIEVTAEQADARGGKGNPKLITWDYGKEINVTIEDALFSAKSMALMFGDGTVDTVATSVVISRSVNYLATANATGTGSFPADQTYTWYDANGEALTSESTIVKGDRFIGVYTVNAASKKVITISGDKFPGTYKVVGDTYARSDATGKDEFFQFVINKAKMSAENTITLEAEGDPSTFNMNLTVLRPENGKMIELIQYSVGQG